MDEVTTNAARVRFGLYTHLYLHGKILTRLFDDISGPIAKVPRLKPCTYYIKNIFHATPNCTCI